MIYSYVYMFLCTCRRKSSGSKDLPVDVTYSKQESVTLNGVANIDSK